MYGINGLENSEEVAFSKKIVKDQTKKKEEGNDVEGGDWEGWWT